MFICGRGCGHFFLVQLLNNITCLLVLARYLEPVWGSKEFLKFVLITNAFTGVITFAYMMTVYFATASEEYLYLPFSPPPPSPPASRI
jgi:membrane associated rhomboid family serine protease